MALIVPGVLTVSFYHYKLWVSPSQTAVTSSPMWVAPIHPTSIQRISLLVTGTNCSRSTYGIILPLQVLSFESRNSATEQISTTTSSAMVSVQKTWNKMISVYSPEAHERLL